MAGHSGVLPKGLVEEYTRSIARRKLGLALNSRSRQAQSLKQNEYLYFYRENLGGYIEPAKVMEISDRVIMKVLYRNNYYSVSREMARKIHEPLQLWIDEETSMDDTGKPYTKAGEGQSRENSWCNKSSRMSKAKTKELSTRGQPSRDISIEQI